MKRFPKRRDDGLLVQELPTETLVYDTARHKAHCLNRLASLVWLHCDGATTEADLAAILLDELKLPVDEVVIRLTLDRLAKAGLLEDSYELASSISRRQASKQLAKFGIAAAGALVATIVAPTAAIAQTSPCFDTPNNECCPPGCLNRPCGVSPAGKKCVSEPCTSLGAGTSNLRCRNA